MRYRAISRSCSVRCIFIDDLFMRQRSPFSAAGCFVDSTTLPGSVSKRYDHGKTAVHEVGHWLGLLHTFNGGCDGDGDHISDTPAQAYATFQCNEYQDTCPAKDGFDLVHNYMGYSYDQVQHHLVNLRRGSNAQQLLYDIIYRIPNIHYALYLGQVSRVEWMAEKGRD
ncbi:hypothetical protein MY4824_007667 [Beauveria thailandica]